MAWGDFEPWYTVEELAHIMCLDYNTALNVVTSYLDYMNVNGQLRVYEDTFLEFMFGQTIYPKGHYNYIE